MYKYARNEEAETFFFFFKVQSVKHYSTEKAKEPSKDSQMVPFWHCSPLEYIGTFSVTITMIQCPYLLALKSYRECRLLLQPSSTAECWAGEKACTYCGPAGPGVNIAMTD